MRIRSMVIGIPVLVTVLIAATEVVAQGYCFGMMKIIEAGSGPILVTLMFRPVFVQVLAQPVTAMASQHRWILVTSSTTSSRAAMDRVSRAISR